MAYSAGQVEDKQAIGLLAEILPFEIRSVEANRGGNTGRVTVQLNGSQFQPGMRIFLRNGGQMIMARTARYDNPIKVFATFDLREKESGLYDVLAIQRDGDTAILENGFSIIEGIEPDSKYGDVFGFTCTISSLITSDDGTLNTFVDRPVSVRPNRTFSFRILYQNQGTIDIPAPSRILLSLQGAPIALDPGDLPLAQQELILDLKEKNGPPDILRPGAKGSITIYAQSIAPLQFQILE